MVVVGPYWAAATLATFFFVVASGLILAHYANVAYAFDMTTSALKVGVLCAIAGVAVLVVGCLAIVRSFQELLQILARQHLDIVEVVSEPYKQYVGEICWSQINLAGTAWARLSDSLVSIGFEHVVERHKALCEEGDFKQAKRLRVRAQSIYDELVVRQHPALYEKPPLVWAAEKEPSSTDP